MITSYIQLAYASSLWQTSSADYFCYLCLGTSCHSQLLGKDCLAITLWQSSSSARMGMVCTEQRTGTVSKKEEKKKKYLNTELVNHYQVHEQAPYNLGCNFRCYSNTVKYFLEFTSEYRCWKNCCKLNSSTKQRNMQSVCHLPSAQLFGEPVSCFYMILALTSPLDFQRMPHANPYLLDVQKVF